MRTKEEMVEAIRKKFNFMVTLKRNTLMKGKSNSSTLQVSYFTTKNYVNRPKPSIRNKFQIWKLKKSHQNNYL